MKTGPWTHASYGKNDEKAMQCRFTLGTQQVCTYYHTFSYILSLSLYNYMYHTKLPKLFHVLHFCVCMNDTRQKFSFCFSELRYSHVHVQSLRFPLEKSLPTFSKLHKMMTFKTVQIYFLSTDPKCIFNNFPILKFPDIYKL